MVQGLDCIVCVLGNQFSDVDVRVAHCFYENASVWVKSLRALGVQTYVLVWARVNGLNSMSMSGRLCLRNSAH